MDDEFEPIAAPIDSFGASCLKFKTLDPCKRVRLIQPEQDTFRDQDENVSPRMHEKSLYSSYSPDMLGAKHSSIPRSNISIISGTSSAM